MRITRSEIREAFKTPQRKSYTIVILTFFTVTFFIFAAIRPTMSKIASIKSNTQLLQVLENEVDTKINTLNTLIAERDESIDNIRIFEKDFPSSEETPILIANLEQIANKYDLLLTSVNFQVGNDASSLNNLSILNVNFVPTTISVEGEMANISKFLDHLEKYPRIIDVKSISLAPIVNSESADKKRIGYSAYFNVNIFYYQPAVDETQVQ